MKKKRDEKFIAHNVALKVNYLNNNKMYTFKITKRRLK